VLLNLSANGHTFASGTSSALYRKVVDGSNLDLAIIAEPPFAIPRSCHWRLLREPLVLLTKASAASRKPHAILASEPFIRLDRNVWPGHLVDGYLRKAGIGPRERFEIDGGAAIAVMVDRGLGVSVMPDWAPPWPEGLSLAKLPLPDAASFARRIGVVWARGSLRIRLIYAFLEQATAAHGPTRKTANSRRRVHRRSGNFAASFRLGGKASIRRTVEHTRIWRLALMSAMARLRHAGPVSRCPLITGERK
jgi:DNA-binding transcriptional LysR family regulator